MDFLQIQTNTNDEIINVLNSQNDLILNKRINNHLFDNKIIESNLDDLSKKSNIVIKNVNDNSNNVPYYNNQFLIKNNNQSTNKEILQNNDNANELIQKQTEILKKYRYY